VRPVPAVFSANTSYCQPVFLRRSLPGHHGYRFFSAIQLARVYQLQGGPHMIDVDGKECKTDVFGKSN